jgi:ABC-type transport system involved in multi-copper enzyme maturation permease subunit
MIRFAWLQTRTQTAVALGGLVVVAVIVAMTGPHLADLYAANIATCTAHGRCATTAIEAFLRNDKTLSIWLGILVIVVPGLVGLFWGAPLIARELETGTYRLAWTQSISRTRWMLVKLAVVALASMAVAGLLSLMITWWANPLDKVNANRFTPPYFDERGIVAIGYAAFAIALGITLGLLIRRTVPAMATTLAAFVLVRLAMIRWVRPNLIAPLHRISNLDPNTMGLRSTNKGSYSFLPPTPNLPNAWIYSNRLIDGSGHALTHHFLTSACPRLETVAGKPGPVLDNVRTKAPGDFRHVMHDCVVTVGAKFHELTTYQPAKNYWTFQWLELAIFLVAALLLSGFCVWWIRRRLA